MKPLVSLSALAALALLAGCAAQPPFGAFRAGLTQELVDTVDNPLLYVGVEGLGRESTVQPLQELDGVTTWRTPDGTSAISTRDGLVVSTRSLGDDLMAADIAGSVAASKGQGAAAITRASTPRSTGSRSPNSRLSSAGSAPGRLKTS